MTTSSGVQNYFETDAYEESRARLLERREAAQRRARELAERRRARELEIQRQLRVGEPARDDDALNSGAARGVKKRTKPTPSAASEELDTNAGATTGRNRSARQALPGAGDDSDKGGSTIVEEVAEVDDPALDVGPTGTGRGRRALPSAGDDSDARGGECRAFGDCEPGFRPYRRWH